MRKILFSLMIIGIASAMLGAGTISYFSDTEIATGNTFSAGKIDLLINCNSTHKMKWPDENQDIEKPIIFEEKNLVPGDKIFNWYDIKPGDYGEATISIHVYDNDAWVWMKIININETGGELTEPEESDYGNVDNGELSSHMNIMIWVDEGKIPGWQNSDDDPTNNDPYEGDNIWQKEYEKIIVESRMSCFIYDEGGIVGKLHLEKCKTYYLGWSWWIPEHVDNIIQGDNLEFDIEFYAEQYRNNPEP